LCGHIDEQQRFGLHGKVLHKPTLLVGTPGSGKTYYAQRFTELTQVPSRLIAIGGMSDNLLLKGSARHWSSSRPSALVEFITESRCPNPIFILDEIDKVGSGKNNGYPYDILIQFMEPRNAATFFDECLLSTVNLSHVSYLATANGTKDLPDPLKDQMMLLHIPKPEPEHLVTVAIHLWWQHWQQLGLHSTQAPAPEPELFERLIVKNPSIR
jgi:ATP-dependent Lon protease